MQTVIYSEDFEVSTCPAIFMTRPSNRLRNGCLMIKRDHLTSKDKKTVGEKVKDFTRSFILKLSPTDMHPINLGFPMTHAWAVID